MMKKFIIAVIACLGALVSCNDELLERIEELEKTMVVSVQASITSLEIQCKTLKNSLASLEQTGPQAEIQTLKASLAAVESKVEELKLHLETLLDGYYTSNEIDVKLKTMNQEIADLKSRLDEIERGIGGVSGTVPKMYNPPVDFHKADLKVLDIGNSYTQDAQAYLPQIVEASGIDLDFSLYRAFRPSASFKTWTDCWNDKDNSNYSIDFCAGTRIDGISGNGSGNNGTLFRNVLESVKWDIILIHQVSTYSNDYTLWEGHGDGGYLMELIQIIRKTNPQATIGYLMTHSYRSTYWSNTEKSSSKRWQNIAEATRQLQANYGIDFIIPYGTAVQNLRESSLNDSYEFSEDGTHMASGLGDYVSACCYYQFLLAPRYGKSILGNTFRVTNLDESIGGRRNVTDKTALTAQKAAMLATYNMWEILNPDKFDL